MRMINGSIINRCTPYIFRLNPRYKESINFLNEGTHIARHGLPNGRLMPQGKNALIS